MKFFRPSRWKLLYAIALLYPFLILCNYVGVVIIVLSFQWALQHNNFTGGSTPDYFGNTIFSRPSELIISAVLAYLLSGVLITVFGKKPLERRIVLYILVILDILLGFFMWQWYTSLDFRKTGVPDAYF